MDTQTYEAQRQEHKRLQKVINLTGELQDLDKIPDPLTKFIRLTININSIDDWRKRNRYVNMAIKAFNHQSNLYNSTRSRRNEILAELLQITTTRNEL